MRKVIMFLVLIMVPLCLFALQSDVPTANLTVNFTAGLIANAGFSSANVQSMLYPESSILTEALVFDYDYSTRRIETGSFFVFAQIFQPGVQVTLKGSPLKKTDETSSISWQSDGDMQIVSNGNEMEVLSVSSDGKPAFRSAELNLYIPNIPSGLNWSENVDYSGSLTLTVKSVQ